MIRRIIASCLAAACVSLFTFPASAPAAVGDPYPLPGTPPTQQVHSGEGLSSFARRLCGSDYQNFYAAVQAMNPYYMLGIHPGQPLWVPSCPVRYSTVSPPSTTTTTSPNPTTTGVPTSTTTSSPSTTSSPTSSTLPASTSTTSTTAASTTSTSSAPTSTQPATCTAPAGQPGSSDGQGGCFPSAATTGPNAPASSMAAYTGPCTITTATTIDSKVIRCLLIVKAPLTIRNSYLYGQVTNGNYGGNGSRLDVSDTYIDGANSAGYACVNCGIDDRNYSIVRSEIVNTNRGAYCATNCVIRDNYVHAQNLDPNVCCPHASGVREEQYGQIIHNTLICDYGLFPNQPFDVGAGDIGCSADLTGYADFAPITHNTVDNNLFMANPVGSSFCSYGGATTGKPSSGDATNGTYQVFRNNVYQRGPNRVAPYGTGPGVCGAYGSNTDFAAGRTGNVWTGNVWSTGGTVPPG